ncbi:DivIVA domain-containing protein [Clostridium saccharobutylicum]|uniref:DivIVA family protein n=1 Tax=Clostridium saccharobutylicum DSM 13864 TaxID=1345695 RepID=U5MVM0_CLOSA|nr:DivIVA domain-containing protein [Clostridium saccharobutylicum]AGX43691.1 DivIVA family protein [Clostridium saccharobutylicum DSM 13864]AQR90989.1 septum site-determining protein DivIVA [Clostridium saccharobutylicum]AQS00893.1 septum site-determining protein DivIVA [Clostridium saccharobutylicum]AQS10631.1 septum site-determining protein DivIVA [Clostridium saccharobutylicum]AQS14876.1 septum site-determining protein DivIVA [Clostridium saccharobutylicum]
MKLTPMDINNKEFKRVLRGYNSDEVDEFLDEVVDSFEELFKENANLKEKLNNLNEKIEHYSKIESTIQNTLLLAQNAAEQARNSAKKESELMIKNANETSQKILDKAHNDVIVVNDEYEKVKQEFIKFRAKYRNFMNAQLETFDDLEKDFIKNYNVSEPVGDEENKDEDNSIAEYAATEEKFEAEQGIDSAILSDELNEIKSFFVEGE